jgi:hypothetical protein
MLKDYGRSYFIKEFGKQAETDEREPVRKYFKLFQGKLLLEKGDSRQALKVLEEIYNQDMGVNEQEYEKLYLARLYEALAMANKESGTTKNFAKFRNQFYVTYPQLIPFSSVRMKFKLNTQIKGGEHSKQILSDLNSFNLDIVTDDKENNPVVSLVFSKVGDKNVIRYSVKTAWGTEIVENSTIIYTQPEGVAKKLAFALFNLKL